MNWTGKTAALFVRNSRLSLLLVVALFAWGAVAYFATPKQYNPRIVAPAFFIQVDFPGADKQEVLEQVTRPLENIVADIPGVEDIFSVTHHGGRAEVTVNFFVGEDLDSAKITLKDRIDSRLNLAPLGIARPVVSSIDPDDVPVLTIALSSDVLDEVRLRKFAFRLRDRLIDVEGASNIEVVGGRRRELAILVDPERMARNRVGVAGIERALERSNVFLPSGRLKTPGAWIPLETSARVTRPEHLGDIVVVTGDVGEVRLRDMARIEERIQEVESHVRHAVRGPDGKIQRPQSVTLISLAKTKSANISTVTDAVSARLAELQASFIPEGVDARIVVNEGDTAAREIGGLVGNLVMAIGIVVLVLLFFLDTRAAVLVAISIPLTLAMVFGAGQLAGQNINRITLFALILSLGLLVDNATVVIENIVRRLRARPDEDRTEVVIASVNQVGPGLFMSTVTTVLAFIPMAFVTGMMGPYMGPIPFFVPAALVFSLFLSFSVNPWMASVLLGGKESAGNLRDRLPARLLAWTDALSAFGTRLFDFYRRYLERLLTDRRARHRALMAIGAFLLLSFVLPGVALVKFRMLPKADREQFFLYIDLPAGAALDETLRVSQAYEERLLAHPEIVMVQSYLGRPPILDFNGLFRGVSARQEPHQATLRVGLTAPEDRGETSETIVLNLRPQLESAAGEIAPGRRLKLKLVEDPPGPPVLSTLLLRVQAHDEELLEPVARDLWRKMAEVDEVTDTDVSAPEPTDTVVLRVDSARASRSRLSPARIVHSMNTLYDGRVLGVYHNRNNIEQEYIRLRMDPDFRSDADDLNKIRLYNDLGIAVRLADLVTSEKEATSRPLRRENRSKTVYVFGEMGDRSITYAAIDILAMLSDYTLPDGKGRLESLDLFGADFRTGDGRALRISIGGEWELTLEVFRDLGLAMGVAIFLVYFVLVAQFGSFREPLIVMSTIPLSLIGVLPGFFLLDLAAGIYFTATSMIGVIALAGIAVNNSIILLEYLNSLKDRPLVEALVQAGTTRFRPIMLTTVTTILGSLTIAGDPVWAGLAFAIVFGLGVSSLLTLIVLPALYYMIKGSDWPTR